MSESHSVLSDCLWPHGLYSPWNSLGQTTGVGSHSLLQRIFPTQGSNPGLMHCRLILYQLSHRGRPGILKWVRSNQSILKEISPECSLEGLMLKLKLQYFGHLLQRADSFEKTLTLGKIEGRRRRGRQRMRWLDGIMDSMDMSLSKLRWWTRRPGMLQSMGLQRVRHNRAIELNWTEPIPSPEDLPDPGIKPGSPALPTDSLPAELPEKPKMHFEFCQKLFLHILKLSCGFYPSTCWYDVSH